MTRLPPVRCPHGLGFWEKGVDPAREWARWEGVWWRRLFGITR